MWYYIGWAAAGLVWGAWLGWIAHMALKRFKERSIERDMERQLRSQSKSSSPQYSMKPYSSFANQPWMVRGDEGMLVQYNELHNVLLMDIRGALWEVRDAIKENTAYLKQVYGDPDGGE